MCPDIGIRSALRKTKQAGNMQNDSDENIFDHNENFYLLLISL